MLGEKQGDYRVKQLLDQLELQYDVDSSGDFNTSFEFEGGRSQAVYIDSETRLVDRLEVRQVWAIGLKSDAPLHADIANALLIYNAHVPIGAWQLICHKEGDGCHAIFVVPVAADTTPKTLLSVMHAVARAADEVEEKFTDEDKY